MMNRPQTSDSSGLGPVPYPSSRPVNNRATVEGHWAAVSSHPEWDGRRGPAHSAMRTNYHRARHPCPAGPPSDSSRYLQGDILMEG